MAASTPTTPGPFSAVQLHDPCPYCSFRKRWVWTEEITWTFCFKCRESEIQGPDNAIYWPKTLLQFLQQEREKYFWLQEPIREPLVQLGLCDPQYRNCIPRNWWFGMAGEFLEFLDRSLQGARERFASAEDHESSATATHPTVATIARIRRKFSGILKRNACQKRADKTQVLLAFLENLPGKICGMVIDGPAIQTREVIQFDPCYRGGLFGLSDFLPTILPSNRYSRRYQRLGILTVSPLSAILINARWKKENGDENPALYFPDAPAERSPSLALHFPRPEDQKGLVLVYLPNRRFGYSQKQTESTTHTLPSDWLRELEHFLYLKEQNIRIFGRSSSTGFDEFPFAREARGVFRSSPFNREATDRNLCALPQKIGKHILPSFIPLLTVLRQHRVSFAHLEEAARKLNVSASTIYAIHFSLLRRQDTRPLVSSFLEAAALNENPLQAKTVSLFGYDYIIQYTKPAILRRNRKGQTHEIVNCAWEITGRIHLDFPYQPSGKIDKILELTVYLPVVPKNELLGEYRSLSWKAFVSDKDFWKKGIQPVLEAIQDSPNPLWQNTLELLPATWQVSLSAQHSYYLAIAAAQERISESRRSALLGYDPSSWIYATKNLEIRLGGKVAPKNRLAFLLPESPDDQIPFPTPGDPFCPNLDQDARTWWKIRNLGTKQVWADLAQTSWTFRLTLALFYSLICGALFRRYHALIVRRSQDLDEGFWKRLQQGFGWRSFTYPELKAILKDNPSEQKEFWLDRRGVFLPLDERESRPGRIPHLEKLVDQVANTHPLIVTIDNLHFADWDKYRRWLPVDHPQVRRDKKSSYRLARAIRQDPLDLRDALVLWSNLITELARDNWAIHHFDTDDVTLYRKAETISLFRRADEVWMYIALVLTRIGKKITPDSTEEANTQRASNDPNAS